MLERLFRLRYHRTDVSTELVAGTTTFLTMSYIVFVNPAVLAQAGMDFGAVMTATCLAAALGTLAMGLAANYPIAMAPGMGQNFFFLTVVTGMGVAWPTALGAVFASGVVFFALTFVGIREHLIESIPASLKHAIAVGIGLFVAHIGLVNAGTVVASATGGPPSLGEPTSPPVLIAAFGLLVTVVGLARGARGAILYGILAASGLAWAFGAVSWNGLVAPPPSLAPTLLALDLRGLADPEMIPIVAVFLFMAVFDAIGTLVGVGEQGGFLVDGRLPRAHRALMADSSATVVGSLLGTSTVTAYVESATGVEAGARTGLANVATGALFLVALFFHPLVEMIGGGMESTTVDGRTLQLYPLTAPALVVVGSLMARNVTKIDWADVTEGLPAFLAMVAIPFTWSIADGIALGFVAHPLVKLLSGRGREVSATAWILCALFVARYALL